MKNREKYSYEILKTIKNGEACNFMKDMVAPEYLDSWESSDEICKKNWLYGLLEAVLILAGWRL